MNHPNSKQTQSGHHLKKPSVSLEFDIHQRVFSKRPFEGPFSDVVILWVVYGDVTS